ncbi:receptor-like protein kinase HERK 1 [Actinidia eriantha]|uniref:receptor-like protein kinase HERK 1 n=1 Tax=Actinidia eriantha TaxID=165200 RepID=UPI0025885B3B|nr:receptor-like protein kinase HERK 1 [Actinidia eriantha]
MGYCKSSLFVWILPTMCLICVSLGVDNYRIDCGSPTNTSVGDRVFVADDFDSNILSTPQDVSVQTRKEPISSAIDLALYQTARVLNGTSSYTFSIKEHGYYWIRLYFCPFVDGNYNLSIAKFSVSAQSFTLLSDFQPQDGSVVKEYCLNINSDNLALTFTPSSNSFAFLNALEIISLPNDLIPDGASTVDPPIKYQTFTRRALETVARVNMGNQTVSPQNDTLWRLWVSDEPFLNHVNLVNFVSNFKAVNYSTKWHNIAPSSVYGTATRLNSQPDPNTAVNMTWFFPVDPGFQYLVRFHFCDIVSTLPEQLFFNVYINTWLVALNLDLSNLTSNVLGAPYIMDVVAKSSNSRNLGVSVGPSTLGIGYPDGILNGLEIMKLSNSRSSLAASDFEVSSTNKVWVILGVAMGGSFIAVLLSLFLFVFCKRRRRRSSLVAHSTEDHFVVDGGQISRTVENKYDSGTAIISSSKIGYRVPFVAIQEATTNFSESLVVGVGGFGKVYKGVLRDGTKVAVKRGVSQQGLEEFRTEIEMLSQFRHRHLVSLIGYCHEQNEMIIIYEYMENGTLKNHLYGSDFPGLSWRQRLEICIGSARGLHYLHTGYAKPIIHRDVKSANILLDENLMSKVADFGISKTGPEIDETHVSTAVKGSFGYLDPEYLTRQQLTEKSDIYSFGVVMFEVLCGRPVIDPSLPREMVNLIEWVMEWEKRGELEKIIDPRLEGEIKPDSLRKFGETAVKCLAECGIDRPTMGDVLWNLECALQLQGTDKRTTLNGELAPQVNAIGNFEMSVCSTQFSVGSAGDLAGISMSGVFSQMVKAENR